MITTITLERVLPRVFRGSDTEEACRRSQVWLSDLTFSRGQCCLIEADSGAGKSSLCSFIYGNRRDYDGTIRFDGTDIRTFSPQKICQLRQRSLAWMPQEMRLFPELTVMENIELKNRLTGTKTSGEIMAMLEALGVAEKAGQMASRLSVGQQQRVAVVRALCQPFDFLLLDEPVSHLDPRTAAQAATLIQDEAARQGAGIIATSVGVRIPLNFTQTIRL